MAPLSARAAAPAAPDPDPKAPHMRARCDRDVLLVLVGYALEIELTATARAAVGQRHLDRLIDMLGNRPVRVTAMLGAAPASRPPWTRLRIILRERRRLALAGAPGRLQLRAKPRVLGQQTLVLRPQPTAPITTRDPQPTGTTPQAS